jgi:hypothetical protein
MAVRKRALAVPSVDPTVSFNTAPIVDEGSICSMPASIRLAVDQNSAHSVHVGRRGPYVTRGLFSRPLVIN